MKFLADVNIPLPLVNLLKAKGHEVQYATTDYPSVGDIELIQKAQDNHQIILTRDKDFLELTKHPKFKVPLIFIRLIDQKTENILSNFKSLLETQPEQVLSNSITILKENIASSHPIT